MRYQLIATIETRCLEEHEAAALEYLVCGQGALPSRLPVHGFFEIPESRAPFPDAYADLAPSEYDFSVTRPSGEYGDSKAGHDVFLRAPYLRLEETHAFFEFLRWTATLVTRDGFLGTLHTAIPNTEPTLLFAYHGELFWDSYKGQPMPYYTHVTKSAPYLGD